MSQDPPDGAPMSPLARDIGRAIASQRSFVGAAAATLVLYTFWYLPGLIFNIIWLRDAHRVRRITGEDPPGLGCLYVMLAGGLAILAVWLYVLMIFGIITFSAISTLAGKPPAKPPATRLVAAPMPRVIQQPARPTPKARATATPRPTPTPRPSMVGKTYRLPHGAVLWNKSPRAINRVSINRGDPITIKVIGHDDYAVAGVSIPWLSIQVQPEDGTPAFDAWIMEGALKELGATAH